MARFRKTIQSPPSTIYYIVYIRMLLELAEKDKETPTQHLYHTTFMFRSVSLAILTYSCELRTYFSHALMHMLYITPYDHIYYT